MKPPYRVAIMSNAAYSVIHFRLPLIEELVRQGCAVDVLAPTFSNAVLEHIPKEEFTQLLFELKRILKKDGICSHRVDLKDHLGGGLNNLRFSSSVWEGSLFRRSGFYTNRIRYGQMLLMFDQAGFSWKVTRKDTWEKLPIVRSSLNVEFQSIPDDDLLVSGFDVVLRHKVNE